MLINSINFETIFYKISYFIKAAMSQLTQIGKPTEDFMCSTDAACKARTMNFSELYDDLAQFICDAEYRWKSVMRIKRCLTDADGLGGYGGDQCYFEGQFFTRLPAPCRQAAYTHQYI